MSTNSITAFSLVASVKEEKKLTVGANVFNIVPYPKTRRNIPTIIPDPRATSLLPAASKRAPVFTVLSPPVMIKA